MVGRLHAWFESMRIDGGYGGPVAHWWRDSLRYAGPGLDWRYEGIVHGYLNLYNATDSEVWLENAILAGQDLVSGQLDSGNYPASAFERNPEFGGTPHEACASSALLRLASVCRTNGRSWQPFVERAKRNLEWHVDALWNSTDESFSDVAGLRSYVPNKIASIVDALLRLANVTEDDTLVENYIQPAAKTILSLQVESKEYSGAIHQLSRGERQKEQNGNGKFFPLYIARCIPPLLSVEERTGRSKFGDAALEAGKFLKRVEHENGSFPQVVYQTGHQIRVPRWIAGTGDVLRAYDTLNEHGYDFSTEATENWLRAGFDACGAFRTARGFGQLHGRTNRPVFRDVLHVVGWNDKAFRWLTNQVTSVRSASVGEAQIACTLDGERGTFVEDKTQMTFTPDQRRRPTYRWGKEERWAQWT